MTLPPSQGRDLMIRLSPITYAGAVTTPTLFLHGELDYRVPIIRDPGDLREIFERKMQERQQMIDRYFVFGEDKFEPHIDYSRTRGLVAEIMNEIDSVEEEIALEGTRDA